MAVVQEMDKPHWIKTCQEFSNHFLVQLHKKAKEYDEVHLIFHMHGKEFPLNVVRDPRKR